MGKIKSDQFDKLTREIEGRLNDFEGGITEKEETIQSFAELIGNIAVNVAKGELKAILQFWGSEDIPVIRAIKGKLENLEEETSNEVITN